MEHTLFIAREVALYTIPPRPSSGGHKSGEWKTADKIFSGRLRCVARGDACEVRIEDPASGELFAMCPVPPGQRPQAVEPASDSSRYFVLRVVDAATGRHAFLGMGFTDRTEAFDFNVALSDHEKHLQRERDVSAAKQAAAEPGPQGDPAGPRGDAGSEAASLYRPAPGALKAGETIKINMKKGSGGQVTGGAAGTGFLAQLGNPDRLVPLAAPPLGPSSSQELRAPPAAAAAPASQASKQTVSLPAGSAPSVDLLGLENPEPQPAASVQSTMRQLGALKPPGAGEEAPKGGSGGTSDWATF